MASLNDYKRHIQVLKMEQKIGRIKRELETVDYGDGCPLHGEDDCAEVRKAYDRGYANGLYEALTLFKLIEADTPQTGSEVIKNSLRTDCTGCKFVGWYDTEFPCVNCVRKNKDYYTAEQTEERSEL